VFEYAILNFTSLENMIGSEALVAFTATISIISYDSSHFLFSLIATDLYKYLRFGFEYNFGQTYLRRSFYYTGALIFRYIFSRAVNKRQR
jgi:hypothetical protein